MKTRRPAQVDPLLWEFLPHGARLALMSHYARTPERAEQLRRAAADYSTKQLEQAVKNLESVTQKKRGSEHGY